MPASARRAIESWSPELVASPRGRYLWELWRRGSRIEAELQDRGSRGVEVEVLRDGALFFSQLYCSREAALRDAWTWKREYETAGWSAPYVAANWKHVLRG